MVKIVIQTINKIKNYFDDEKLLIIIKKKMLKKINDKNINDKK